MAVSEINFAHKFSALLPSFNLAPSFAIQSLNRVSFVLKCPVFY